MQAIITGASKGMGRAIALALAAEGYSLGLLARNETDLDLLKQELETTFPILKFVTVAADCGSSQALQTALERIKTDLKQVTVIVNNVGAYFPGNINEEEESNLLRMLDLNLLSAYRTSRFFLPDMIKNQRGHIFSICSSASIKPQQGIGSYSISKYALYGFMKNLREELKPYRIKVTSILPGSTLTHSWEGTDIPAEKFILPEDIALAIVSSLKMSAGAAVEEIIINPVQPF